MKRSKNKQLNQKRLTDLYTMAATLIIYFFYMKSKDIILNYPYYLLFISFICIFIILIRANYRKTREKYFKTEKSERAIFIGLAILKLCVISYFTSGILLIPINYYIIYKSQNNYSTFEKCEIEGIATETQNRKLFYKFKGDIYAIYDYDPIMEEIKNNKKFVDYVFCVEFKKGLLDTYILENWHIKKNKRHCIVKNERKSES